MVGADADEDLGSGVAQPMAEGDWVIAGVEDEHRDYFVVRQQADDALHLLDGRVVASSFGVIHMPSSGAVQESGARSCWVIRRL